MKKNKYRHFISFSHRVNKWDLIRLVDTVKTSIIPKIHFNARLSQTVQILHWSKRPDKILLFTVKSTKISFQISNHIKKASFVLMRKFINNELYEKCDTADIKNLFWDEASVFT